MSPLLVLLALSSIASAAGLQQSMNAAMRARAGTAIVLAVDSGRILAIYHPEIAARRLARPGSAIKPFTLLALLDSGAPSRTILCQRQLRIGPRQMDCTHPLSAEPFDAVAALAYSCNFYFATRASTLRNSDLIETFTRAGLISPVGELVPPTTVEARQLMALGEANILVTPLAMASAYRKLALSRKDPSRASIFEGLAAATEYGTARLARPIGISTAGKTGTASDPGGGAIHAWFAGYAPAESPRIVVLVFLEQGAGSRDAAPIAGKLFKVALQTP